MFFFFSLVGFYADKIGSAEQKRTEIRRSVIRHAIGEKESQIWSYNSFYKRVNFDMTAFQNMINLNLAQKRFSLRDSISLCMLPSRYSAYNTGPSGSMSVF